MYSHICVYICICIYIYIYFYIETNHDGECIRSKQRNSLLRTDETSNYRAAVFVFGVDVVERSEAISSESKDNRIITMCAFSQR